MSKIKILDTNKNLYDNAKAMFEKVLAMQTDAERQMKEMREVETKVQSIEKSNQAKEEQRKKKEEEEKRRLELEAAEKLKQAKEPEPAAEKEEAAAEAEPPKEEPAAETLPEEPRTQEQESNVPEKTEVKKTSPAEPKAESKPAQKKKAASEPKPAAKQPAPEKKPAEKKAPAERKKQAPDKKSVAEKKPAAKQETASSRPNAPASRGGADHAQNRRRKEDADRNKKKKPAIRERVFSVDEEEFPKGSRKRPGKKAPKRRPIEPVRIDRAVITEDTVSVKLLSEKIGKPVAEILKKLLLLGMMSTINSQIDFDTAQLVAGEFGVELEQKLEKTAEEILVEETEDTPETLEKRPPVVTIMGHVDHGKTSLLDKIRMSHVTDSEAGGITQHIGAYQVELNGEKITFIDTPGHEAFTAMRARGAQVTDVAIIVVAADDGIMPQTIEAINHAKSADVPIVVAVNKIDRENANVQRIMQELTEYELVPEDWGGDTVVVPVSAKTGEGIDKLLEMVLLVAEMQELKANPHRLAKGTIIEAQLDKGRGPVATVLVQNGTLKVGDTIIAGVAFGRVRAMVDDMGRSVKEALPAQPVEVIGFSEVPVAGDIMHAAEGSLSRKVAEERKDHQKAEMLKKVTQVSLDDLFSQIAEGQIKELNIVVKADVQGSVEAVRQSLEKLSNDEVRVRAIHTGVGAITETDVMLASAANAIVIGFNVRPDNMAIAAGEREKVDIRLYRVIYKAIEDIENAMNGLLEPEFEESVTGHGEVRQIFRVSSVGTVAGCYVTDGTIHRNSKARLYRDNVLVYEGALSSLRRFKDDVKEVAQGYECGLTLENYNDIKEGDVVECFEMKEIER